MVDKFPAECASEGILKTVSIWQRCGIVVSLVTFFIMPAYVLVCVFDEKI